MFHVVLQLNAENVNLDEYLPRRHVDLLDVLLYTSQIRHQILDYHGFLGLAIVGIIALHNDRRAGR